MRIYLLEVINITQSTVQCKNVPTEIQENWKREEIFHKRLKTHNSEKKTSEFVE